MRKDYGKLTRPQLQRVAKLLPRIRQDFDSLPEIIKAAPAEKVREILGENFQPAFAYELPVAGHVALIITAFGQGQKLRDLAASDDPQEALLAWMDQESEAEVVAPFGKGLVLGLIVTLLRSIQSIIVYGRPMSTSAEEVRAGNDASLFLAVRMDRSSVGCPTIASRIHPRFCFTYRLRRVEGLGRLEVPGDGGPVRKVRHRAFERCCGSH